MSKAEEKPVSEYGEPWQYSDLEGLICIDRENGRPVAMDFDEPDARRAIACVNCLAGIPNPEAVRELVEAAKAWRNTDSDDAFAHGRLVIAVDALSAPSTAPPERTNRDT